MCKALSRELKIWKPSRWILHVLQFTGLQLMEFTWQDEWINTSSVFYYLKTQLWMILFLSLLSIPLYFQWKPKNPSCDMMKNGVSEESQALSFQAGSHFPLRAKPDLVLWNASHWSQERADKAFLLPELNHHLCWLKKETLNCRKLVNITLTLKGSHSQLIHWTQKCGLKGRELWGHFRAEVTFLF